MIAKIAKICGSRTVLKIEKIILVEAARRLILVKMPRISVVSDASRGSFDSAPKSEARISG
jgi:hypothetical protein